MDMEVKLESKVRATAVASSAGALELDTHSSPEDDPLESSPPPVSVAPMVLPFLCTDDSDSDIDKPERNVSPTTYIPKTLTAPILPAPSAIVAPSSEFPHAHTLTMRKLVRPLPSHRLELRYTSHHLDCFTSGLSSSHSSSDHLLFGHSSLDHSLSGHTPPDTTDTDSSTPQRFVHPPLARTPQSSRAYLRWRSAPLATMYPPMTSESSTEDSSFESSVGPSRKRCRSPTATMTSSIHSTRALDPSCVDLLPPRKRFRDSISTEDGVEEDIYMDLLEDIEADAIVVEVAVDRDVEARINEGIDIEVDVEIDVEDKVKDEVESSDRGIMKVRVDMDVKIDIPDDHSSSGHSITGHSLSIHTPPDTSDADSSTPPRFVHLSLARTLRCSEAYLRWRSAPLSTMYPPTTSESSAGDSSSESYVRPSHKRCRSPATTVISSIHDTRSLVPSRADLLPPHKRFRDFISPEDIDRDVEAGIDAGFGMEVDVGVDVEDEVEDEVESNDRGTIEVGVDVAAGIDIPNGMLMPDVVERLEQVEEGLQDIYDHVIEIPLQRIEDIETGQRELEARSLIAGRERERASLLEQVASLERSNARLRGTMMMERARADSFRRRVRFIESELRQIRRFRYYEKIDRAGLSNRTGSLERENLKVRALLCIERDRVDSLRRHMALSQEEFRQNMIITRSGMTPKAIEELVNRLVEEALAAYEVTRAANAPEAKNQSQNGSDGNNGNGGNRNGKNGNGENGNARNGNPNENNRDVRPVVQECTYQDFMKYQSLKFKGTEGVVGLTRWFEKMEIVFHISNCPEKYQVKYATCTLLNSALTWWNSHKRTVRTDAAFTMSWRELMKLMLKMVPEEEDRIESLMDQKLKGYAVQNAENNRRLEVNQRDNRGQQPPFKRPNVRGQKVVRTYTAGNNKRRPYNGPLSLCNKCKLYHEGPCTVRCRKCNKVGYLTRDCKVIISTTSTQKGQVVNQRIITFFECGRVGFFNHYAFVLFDLGADRSFISSTFSTLLDIILDTLDVSYVVELADERISKTNIVLKGCMLGLLGHPFNIDLMPVELVSFDVIISMDWLVNHHAMTVCDEKIVRIPYRDEVLIVQGDEGKNGEKSKLGIISCTKTQKYIKRSCLIFLVQVTKKETEDKSEEKQLEDVPTVRDFPKVFPEDLPGLPPIRQVEI
nr:hypothetical protein [Tanacetum cinerariifolium]